MKKVYVAHPFCNNMSEKADAERIIKALAKEHPDTFYVSPIHATGFLYDSVPYLQGMEYCYELLGWCDVLLLTGHWQVSRGCMLEKTYAEKRGIPVMYLDPQGGVTDGPSDAT